MTINVEYSKKYILKTLLDKHWHGRVRVSHVDISVPCGTISIVRQYILCSKIVDVATIIVRPACTIFLYDEGYLDKVKIIGEELIMAGLCQTVKVVIEK